MSKLRSAFQDHLDQRITEGVSFITENQWSIGSALPDVARIEPLLQNYLGSQETPPPQNIKSAASLGPSLGTSYEALGQLENAMHWYQLGQYIWRGGKQFDSVGEMPADYASRATAGRLQLEAAICADRVGSTDRTHDLYKWAVENRRFTEKEILELDQSGRNDLIWKWAIQRIYALFCLGEYLAAYETSEDVLRRIEKDPEAKFGTATEMPLLILPTVLALIQYELDQTPENRADAVELLDQDAVGSRIHADHFQALFYLFNLRAKYPELAAPDDSELPPAARAQQGAEACRRWISKAGIHLDSTLKSLMVMDEHLKEIYGSIRDEEQQKLVLFMLGSYFGELVRHELAGGKWNFSADAMLAWTVDWVIGEIELQFWPYQRVHEYATGKTDQSLMDLWEETKQAYLEFGRAARFNE